ncbi:MAG: hypothetical protein V1720_11570, partial [bacterium]
MKIFLLLLCLPIILSAQSNVKRLTEQLDLLSKASFNNWKYTTDFSLKAEDLSDMNFDDSKWQNLKLNDHLTIDSCWFRKIIEVPDYIAGAAVRGALKFLTSVDDYGYMWINGESRGRFPWDGEFLLTSDAKPGEKFVIVIKAINTGGPLRLIRAKLDFNQPSNVQNLIRNLSLSMRVGEKLLSFDTYQT